MKNIFTIDVEDWYHILDLPSSPGYSEWNCLPSRVEMNYMRLLDILSEKRMTATCFFLGYIAARFPELVRETVRRGHEIASHGHAHRLIYEMTPHEFVEDAVRSRKTIEDIGGTSVKGYRAPGFSVTEKSPWFYDRLAAAGYEYDASLFPAAHQHGGMLSKGVFPHIVTVDGKKLVEFPISIVNVAGVQMCFFGGGYLRLFPYSIIRHMSHRVMSEKRPIIYYIHPRDIDCGQPRLKMGLKRRFRSYVNLHTTEVKLKQILDDFTVTTFRQFMQEEGIEKGI